MVGRRAGRGAAGKLRSRSASASGASGRASAHVELAQVLARQEQDHRRLAQELHDELGQTLAALELGLAQIELEKAEELPQRARALRHAVRSASGELRRVIAGLYPVALERFGLGAALESLVHERSRITGMKIRLCLSPSPLAELPGDVSLAAYRVVQASLANCLAHAKPHTIAIAVVADGSRLRVTVADDGAGFGAAAHEGSGLGLSGMRQRVAAIGGCFRVTSVLGHGTEVVAEFIVPDQGRAA
jgi:two-component system, NarL family, sensor histidine kinase UhpB